MNVYYVQRDEIIQSNSCSLNSARVMGGTDCILLQINVISYCYDFTGSCPDIMPPKMVNLLFTKLFTGLKMCKCVYK